MLQPRTLSYQPLLESNNTVGTTERWTCGCRRVTFGVTIVRSRCKAHSKDFPTSIPALMGGWRKFEPAEA